MVQTEITNLLHEIGKIFSHIAKNHAYNNSNLAITESEYEDLDNAVRNLNRVNPWFTEENTRLAIGGVASWLNKEDLENWLSNYQTGATKKTVAIIMAGNIPLVGFHDFLCVILSGHKALCKFSSQDAPLWTAILKMMVNIDVRFGEHFAISSGKLTDFDAVIATGSNNSAVTFKHYFEQYPHIIRQNRTSVAVLNGNESDEDLKKLAEDVFSYFGFGCRNVTQLFVPENFDVQRLFANFIAFGDWINHHKYMNNFDYYRALYLMNGEEILENGFVIMRFNQLLHAPPAVINCYRYESIDEVNLFIATKESEIQAVVGHSGIPFGSAQCPSLLDYADGVDTMKFLTTAI